MAILDHHIDVIEDGVGDTVIFYDFKLRDEVFNDLQVAIILVLESIQ